MVFVHSSSGCFAKVDGEFATRTERAVLCRSDHVILRYCSSVFSTIVRTWLGPIFAVWRRATSRISWWRPGHFINAKKLRRFVRLAERLSGPMTSWQFMRHSGVLYFQFQIICYSVIGLTLRSAFTHCAQGVRPSLMALDRLPEPWMFWQICTAIEIVDRLLGQFRDCWKPHELIWGSRYGQVVIKSSRMSTESLSLRAALNRPEAYPSAPL